MVCTGGAAVVTVILGYVAIATENRYLLAMVSMCSTQEITDNRLSTKILFSFIYVEKLFISSIYPISCHQIKQYIISDLFFTFVAVAIWIIKKLKTEEKFTIKNQSNGNFNENKP